MMGTSLRGSRHFTAGAFALVLLAAASSHVVAAPDTQAPIIVLEAHVGERTQVVAGLMVQLRDQLETHGFAARPETISKLVGGRAPRPGILDDVTLAEIARQFDEGYAAYMKADFERAVKLLGGVTRTMRRNPGLLVTDTGNASKVFRAYVVHSLGLAKLGKAPESVAVMTELIRMYRSQPLSPAEFGPQAEEFYRKVSKQVLAMGRGSLSVTVGKPQAIIFIDGQFRALGNASLGDLIPGVYQVFIQVPGTTGRQYEIEVRAGDESKLEVAWDLDSSLWISEPWIGFQFATDAERGKEATYAGQVARRWSTGDLVAVIGTTRLQGKPAVIGTLYRSNGKVVRSAMESTDGSPEANVRALAKFLADGTPGAGIDIVSDESATRASATLPPEQQSRRTRWFIYGGVAILAVGIGVYALDEDPGPSDVEFYRDTAPHGIALGVTGLATIGFGIWWSLRDQPSSSAPTVSVGYSQASIGWAGRF